MCQLLNSTNFSWRLHLYFHWFACMKEIFGTRKILWYSEWRKTKKDTSWIICRIGNVIHLPHTAGERKGTHIHAQIPNNSGIDCKTVKLKPNIIYTTTTNSAFLFAAYIGIIYTYKSRFISADKCMQTTKLRKKQTVMFAIYLSSRSQPFDLWFAIIKHSMGVGRDFVRDSYSVLFCSCAIFLPPLWYRFWWDNTKE